MYLHKRWYRFGHFEISIDAAVLNMPGWLTTLKDEQLKENLSKDIEIQDDIFQPEENHKSDFIEYGFTDFTDLYPKLWPFSRPKITK